MMISNVHNFYLQVKCLPMYAIEFCLHAVSSNCHLRSLVMTKDFNTHLRNLKTNKQTASIHSSPIVIALFIAFKMYIHINR